MISINFFIVKLSVFIKKKFRITKKIQENKYERKTTKYFL